MVEPPKTNPRPGNGGALPVSSDAGLLAAIVESAGDAIISKSLEGVVTSWNHGAEQLFGYTAAEMVGRLISVLAAPGHEGDFSAILEKVARGERVNHFETVRRAKDGHLVRVSLSVSPVRDAAGSVIGAAEIARDIIDGERAEKRLQAILETVSDGFLVLDHQWRFAYINRQAAELIGRTPSDLIGRNIWEAVPQLVGTPAEENYRKVMAEQVSTQFEMVGPVTGRCYRIDVYPSPEGLFIYGQDITERRRTEEALQQSLAATEQAKHELEFQKRALDAAAIVAITDVRGTITYVNDTFCHISGYSREELLGQNHRILNSGFHPKEFFREMYATIGKGHVWRGEIRNRAKDGHYYWVDTTIVPFLGADGRPEQYVAIRYDISERKRFEEQLREADRRKDEFLAMLSHELRNPLAAVSNAVTVLKMSNDADNISFAKDVIERQTKQLAYLVDDLLDVSRITTGKIRLKRELCDAGTILKQAIESVEPLINGRKHVLTVDFEEGTLPLRADPSRVEQIVVNLLTNAAKYTESGGRIRLSAGRSGHQIVISVEDNGMGIPPEELPEMFKLFAQGERSIARSEGGLGIGLTIVQKLAEMHGGSVTAKSDGPGKGSTFTVRLPAVRRAALTTGKPGSTLQAEKRGSRILVVDDNVDTARSMLRLLKILGNDVVAAHDGPSAIDAARILKPEFILLDIGLPGMDGYEVAARLREEACCRAAVIIAVSGYGQDEDRRCSREAGFDHHLVKPVDFNSLLPLIACSV